MDIGGSHTKPLKTKQNPSTTIHQLREKRSTTGGLKNRQHFELVDCAPSLVDRLFSSSSLFTKEKEREKRQKAKNGMVDENADLVDENADLVEQSHQLVINFCSMIKDLAATTPTIHQKSVHRPPTF